MKSGHRLVPILTFILCFGNSKYGLFNFSSDLFERIMKKSDVYQF